METLNWILVLILIEIEFKDGGRPSKLWLLNVYMDAHWLVAAGNDNDSDINSN